MGYGYHNCKLFWRAIQKYGWDNIQHIVLMDNLSKEIACECEKYLIRKYKSNQAKFGYNNSFGGESGSCGYVFTMEQRAKVSNSLRGHVVSEETRRKIGQANSVALKGRKVPQEVKDKISKHSARGFLGKHRTDEAIKTLENSDTTVENVSELASLYICQLNLKNRSNRQIERVEDELDDILPYYTKYREIKTRYQLNQTTEGEVIQGIKNVCREIQQFIDALYSGTDMNKERICINKMIEQMHEKYSK